MVDGSTYEPIGAIRSADGKEHTNLPVTNGALYDLAQICSCCNYSKIAYDEVRNISFALTIMKHELFKLTL
jgi:hypothetical protein